MRWTKHLLTAISAAALLTLQPALGFAQTQGSRAVEMPIEVHVGALANLGDELAGHRIVLHAAEITHVLGPRLIVVKDPRMAGEPIFEHKWEEVLVVLPSPTSLGK